MAKPKDKKTNLPIIVDKLNENASLGSTGDISFKTFNIFNEAEILLCNLIEFNEQIPEIEKKSIIDKSIFSLIKKNNLTTRTLLSEISKNENIFYTSPIQKFSVITTISLSPNFSLSINKINGCTISFKPFIWSKYNEGYGKTVSAARSTLHAEIPTNYCFIKVSVSARSEVEALNKALDSVDLLRGIWNLSNNHPQISRMSSGKRIPVNNFILGPVHVLFDQKGETNSNHWWYETKYRGPINPFRDQTKFEKIISQTKKFKTTLSKCCFKEFVETAILRYTRALDLVDWEDSFLKLWGVLEYLTHTQQLNYDITIQRASFLFEERDYVRQVLQVLRNCRNEAIHVGSSQEKFDIESLLYQLKWCVEVLIIFHTNNHLKLSSIEEVTSFLSSSNDGESIDSKIMMLKSVKKFLGL